jgi:hypothetical protein
MGAMPRVAVFIAVPLVTLQAALATAHAAPPRLTPPVDGPIERRFEAPPSPYWRGHRGVDYAVASGSPVRAAAAGAVTFAGPVAGLVAVTIAHEGGLASTYSRLTEVYVSSGERVALGSWIGLVGTDHQGASAGLHFGVKLGGRYVDPEDFMTPLDAGRAIHLASLNEEGPAPCAAPSEPAASPPPPNDNVAVAIPGIASHTSAGGGTEQYRSWLTRLGYAHEDAYVFSYRAVGGPDLHRPYARADTYGDLRVAARRLGVLLARIARSRPGVDIDLVAHSQGGLVARALLQRAAGAGDARRPRVEHVITLATPQEGTPLAGFADSLPRGSAGGVVLRALAWLARKGWLPLPAPDSGAVRDLVPGSRLLLALARQDVAYGTRVLSLAMPHDLLVPVDRARLRHEVTRVVPPRGLWGHRAVLGSDVGRALAYDFLRDAPLPCLGPWDLLGPLLGRVTGWGVRALGAIVP